MRLRNIETLSSSSKTALLKSIANDISAVFIYISKQSEAGNLSTKHTAPIDNVIRLIKGTEVSQRRMLERRVLRYERQASRLRAERRWIRGEFMKVVKRAEAVSERWREKVGKLSGDLDGTRRDLSLARREYELLKEKAKAEVEVDRGEGKKNGDEACESQAEVAAEDEE
ncbi:hypothetical protein MW887_008884 [Aspergillus wentii]|nr:hypothetical protein MW887_008884 [Aspergillus wentii]